MRLLLFGPKWDRPCALCELVDFDDDGNPKRQPTGDPVRRPPKAPTPCTKCDKVPTWAKAAGKSWKELRALAEEMTPANREAYAAYVRMKATNRPFPEDELVDWYSGIIRKIEDHWNHAPIDRLCTSTQALLTSLSILYRRR